jgi:hypothetical protein
MSVPQDPPRGGDPVESATQPFPTCSCQRQIGKRFEGETHLTPYNQDLAEHLRTFEVHALKNLVVKADRDDTR